MLRNDRRGPRLNKYDPKRRAQTPNIGGSKGRQGRAPPLDPISLNFHAVFGEKKLPNNRFFHQKSGQSWIRHCPKRSANLLLDQFFLQENWPEIGMGHVQNLCRSATAHDHKIYPRDLKYANQLKRLFTKKF